LKKIFSQGQGKEDGGRQLNARLSFPLDRQGKCEIIYLYMCFFLPSGK